MIKPARVVIALVATAIMLVFPASAKPPIEAFGDAPEIRAMDISPDGKKLAYINRHDGTDFLYSYDVATNTPKVLGAVGEIRARGVQFVGNDYIVLVASRTTKIYGFVGRHEVSAAFAYSYATGKISQLLVRTKNLYPGQSDLGTIVGIDPDGKHVFMPAYMDSIAGEPYLHLLRVDLDSGAGSIQTKGDLETTDWIVDEAGNPIMREEFDERRKLHEVKTFVPGGAKTIYTRKTDLPEIGVVGASSDGQSLIAIATNESNFMSLYRMDRRTGELMGPLFERPDAEVDGVVIDSNRVVHGVRYSGMTPQYEMFDKALEKDLKAAQAAFDGATVRLAGWTKDWSTLLLMAEGGAGAERYALFQRNPQKLMLITRGRSQIKDDEFAAISTIEYKARDGLKITGLITWPVGVAPDQRKNLPMVVMPHGGPEAYDSIGFDWLAQFLANEGYVVLQPNFRGSGGFGSKFAKAGHGEWGRKMQDDITDGRDAMVKVGWADPGRTCIMGWSYGGYAALAGGALTPDKYNCIVSVAGVSNLRQMLADDRDKYGPRSRIVTYWQNLIGDPSKDGAAIDAVSPAGLAANFKAPVLLIHGTDDTNVPSRQSDMMNDALKREGKPVEYVKIKGDDHGLVDNDSRRTALTKIAEFLAKYLK